MDHPPIILAKLGYHDHKAASLISVSFRRLHDLVKFEADIVFSTIQLYD